MNLPEKLVLWSNLHNSKLLNFVFFYFVLPTVLSLLPNEIYEHFLLLHCAIRILSCPERVKIRSNVEFVRTLLLNFVKSSKDIYGDAFLLYNVHNLIHLADEVLHFGALYVFSCAPFENHRFPYPTLHIGVLSRSNLNHLKFIKHTTAAQLLMDSLEVNSKMYATTTCAWVLQHQTTAASCVTATCLKFIIFYKQ